MEVHPSNATASLVPYCQRFESRTGHVTGLYLLLIKAYPLPRHGSTVETGAPPLLQQCQQTDSTRATARHWNVRSMETVGQPAPFLGGVLDDSRGKHHHQAGRRLRSRKTAGPDGEESMNRGMVAKENTIDARTIDCQAQWNRLTRQLSDVRIESYIKGALECSWWSAGSLEKCVKKENHLRPSSRSDNKNNSADLLAIKTGCAINFFFRINARCCITARRPKKYRRRPIRCSIFSSAVILESGRSYSKGLMRSQRAAVPSWSNWTGQTASNRREWVGRKSGKKTDRIRDIASSQLLDSMLIRVSSTRHARRCREFVIAASAP